GREPVARLRGRRRRPGPVPGRPGRPPRLSSAGPAGAPMSTDLTRVLDTAVRDALAYIRTLDADAGADLAELRRRQLVRPSVVIVGETKRGKSSLINALLGVPGLSPVDAAVATATYLQFVPGDPAARAWPPGAADPIDVDDLREWATGR